MSKNSSTTLFTTSLELNRFNVIVHSSTFHVDVLFTSSYFAVKRHKLLFKCIQCKMIQSHRQFHLSLQFLRCNKLNKQTAPAPNRERLAEHSNYVLTVCVCFFFCYAVSQPRRWNLDVLKFDEHLVNVAHDSIYSAYASLFVMAQTQRNVVFIVVAKHNSVDIFKLNGKKDLRNRRQDKNISGDQESNVFVRLFAARFCQQPTQRQCKQAKLSFEEISNKSYSINVVIKSSICYQICCALITMISFCIQ